MESVEEVAAAPPPQSNNTTTNDNKDVSPIAKGKRTKRQRPHSPIPFTITPPAITLDYTDNRRSPGISAASSEESTTTAEVDTARCLILLSRGHFPDNLPPSDNRKTATTAAAKATSEYACKTCNRVFPSFQALGGHRASHKKPKNEKKFAMFSDEEDFPSPRSLSSSKHRFSSNSLSLQLSNISTTTFSATPKSSPSPRIHECSYCGAEFTSGQALGGHMRKHRAGPMSRALFPQEVPIDETEHEESKKLRTGLPLDLNLPAPEYENQKFGLSTRQDKSPGEKSEAAGPGLVLSTTTTAQPLVDCHY